MTGSVNKVIIVGNLGADPEVRHLPSGQSVVNLRVATSEIWNDKSSGERRERTEWHAVSIFSPVTAKYAENYLRKGSKVYVEGRMQTRKWQDQTGQDRYATEIVVNNIGGQLLGISSIATNQDDEIAPAKPNSGSNFDVGDVPF